MAEVSIANGSGVAEAWGMTSWGTSRDGKQIFYSLADLSKHRLGSKSESAKRGVNAAKFGPAELIFPKK